VRRRRPKDELSGEKKFVKKRIEIEVDKVYRKLEQTKSLIDVAREPLALQKKENLRLKSDGMKAGTVTEAQHAAAVAAIKKNEEEEVHLLGYNLAVADLKRIVASNASSCAESGKST
jgi:hypothetical protein